jgi:hypothetical protein
MEAALKRSTPAGATLAALAETYWEVATMGAYDTPRLRLTAQRSASSEIKEADGPRSDLDAWRLAGGRPRRLATLSRAA